MQHLAISERPIAFTERDKSFTEQHLAITERPKAYNLHHRAFTMQGLGKTVVLQ